MERSYNKDERKRDSMVPKEKQGVYFPFMINSLDEALKNCDDTYVKVKGIKVEKVFGA
jgi:hypothetical protein